MTQEIKEGTPFVICFRCDGDGLLVNMEVCPTCSGTGVLGGTRP